MDGAGRARCGVLYAIVTVSLAPILTPQGYLTLGPTEDAPVLEAELAARLQPA